MRRVKEIGAEVWGLIRTLVGHLSRPARFGDYVVFEHRDTLLTFPRPDDAAAQRIAQLLRDLPIVPARGMPDKGDAPTYVGPLAGVVERLSDVLHADYVDMVEFTTTELAVAFDYVVYLDLFDQTTMRVDTRMRDRERAGSVSYGRWVRRVGEDEYWLWVNDSRGPEKLSG